VVIGAAAAGPEAPLAAADAAKAAKTEDAGNAAGATARVEAGGLFVVQADAIKASAQAMAITRHRVFEAGTC
jgi:hypothetical protein